MNKLTQGARQVLKALENRINGMCPSAFEQKSITAMREALDHSAATGKVMLATEQAQQIEEALDNVINDWVAPDDFPFEDGEMPALDGARNALATIRAARAQEDTVCGFSLWLNRESWGHVVDGLMLERERSEQRKTANPESNSNIISDRCAELITQINDAGGAIRAARAQEQNPVAWYDKIKGMEVSVDVSTGEDDDYHRIFGRVDGVMLQSCGAQEDTILVIEDSRNFDAPQPMQEPVAIVDEIGLCLDGRPIFNAVGKVKVGQKLYAAPVRTKDLTDFGCVPNSNGTTNQRGELLSALEALLEDYIHRVQDAWIEAGGSDISREEVLTNCEPARNAAAAIANMTGATDELP